ncbi:MAG: hypothetical protein KatS3mg031_1756 [Chitinophagales bacterium]|nr:MAG: hypothetical protein KatS3mg031_1756 [Chitinophagales bacterium]
MNAIAFIGALVRKNLLANQALIKQLSAEQYCHPLSVLSGFSIGQHFRHIIEFYLCLFGQLESGTICYDERKRDVRIESNPEFAIQCIESILADLQQLQTDKRLTLKFNLSCEDDTPVYGDTSLCRELAFVMEHSIHHQALIKIGLSHFPGITVDEQYGVAPSTIRCARKSKTVIQ